MADGDSLDGVRKSFTADIRKASAEGPELHVRTAIRTMPAAAIDTYRVQNLLWLSGIVLASNGMVIALLARLAGAI